MQHSNRGYQKWQSNTEVLELLIPVVHALYHIELVIHIYREILAPRSDSMCYQAIGLYPDAIVESHGTSGCSLIGLFPHPAPEPGNEASK